MIALTPVALLLLLAEPEAAPKPAPAAPEAAPSPARGDRNRASTAIEAARSAVSHASGSRQKQASDRLREAEALFASARYAEANQAADAAWQLVKEGSEQGAKFSVEVADSGRTVVSAHAGHTVRVEAQGVTRRMGPGQVVAVEKGSAPSEPETPPGPPVLVSPSENQKLTVKPKEKVTLAWKPTPGAKGYEVEVVPAQAQGPGQGEVTVRVTKPEAKLALQKGRYLWTVRSLGEVTRSEPAQARAFELEAGPDPLRLEVKGTGWK